MMRMEKKKTVREANGAKRQTKDAFQKIGANF